MAIVVRTVREISDIKLIEFYKYVYESNSVADIEDMPMHVLSYSILDNCNYEFIFESKQMCGGI